MEFRARRLVARAAHPGSWHVVKRWNFPKKHRDEFGDFEPWRARTGTCKSSRGVMSSNALSRTKYLVRRTTLTKGAIQARACAESNYAIPVRAKHPAGILSGAKLSLKASTELSCHHGIGLPPGCPTYI